MKSVPGCGRQCVAGTPQPIGQGRVGPQAASFQARLLRAAEVAQNLGVSSAKAASFWASCPRCELAAQQPLSLVKTRSALPDGRRRGFVTLLNPGMRGRKLRWSIRVKRRTSQSPPRYPLFITRLRTYPSACTENLH